MSAAEEVLKANENYANDFQWASLPMPPSRHLAIVACMDARMNIPAMLGLKTGDAHIIRNAGGIVTEDVIRSLIISQRLLGTNEVVIINHTDCGMLTFQDQELRAKVERETGIAMDFPRHFHSFLDVDANLRRQIRRLRNHPWIPAVVPIRGFVYDVKTGRLSEVGGKEVRACGQSHHPSKSKPAA